MADKRIELPREVVEMHRFCADADLYWGSRRLLGVALESEGDGSVAMATEGHVMCVHWLDAAGPETPLVVSGTDLARSAEKRARGHAIVGDALTWLPGEEDTAITVEPALLAGVEPHDWRKLLADAEALTGGLPRFFTPRLIGLVGKYLKAIGHCGVIEVTHGGGEANGIIMQPSPRLERRTVFLLMPARNANG